MRDGLDQSAICLLELGEFVELVTTGAPDRLDVVSVALIEKFE